MKKINTESEGNTFKFSHDPLAFGREDGGGITRIEANDQNSIIHLDNHFKLTKDPLTLCQWIYADCAVATAGTEKRPSFVREVVNTEQLAPYLTMLKARTGYEFQPTDHISDLAPRYKWSGICYTHYVESAEILGHALRAVVHVSNEGGGWNGDSAAEYAGKLSGRAVIETLSSRHPIPEYIPARRGSELMKLNPDYGTGKKGALRYDCDSLQLLVAIMDWWMENHATEEQIEIVNADETLYENLFPAIGHVGSLRSNRFERGLRTSWKDERGPKNSFSWEEFADLGKTPLAAIA